MMVMGKWGRCIERNGREVGKMNEVREGCEIDESGIPLLGQEGWTRHQENIAEGNL